MLRAALIGASLAVVVVAAVVVLAVLGVAPFAHETTPPGTGPVLVALVLPSTDGVVRVRVIDLYRPAGTRWTVASISPSATAVVSGAQGDTVADAYSFGGGAGLASAVRDSLGLPVSDWVVVDAGGWQALTDSANISVRVPADIELFDGGRLYSFAASETTEPAGETAQLLEGASVLPADQGRVVRTRVGDDLGAALSSATPSAVALLGSDMKRGELSAWVAKIRGAVRVNGP